MNIVISSQLLDLCKFSFFSLCLYPWVIIPFVNYVYLSIYLFMMGCLYGLVMSGIDLDSRPWIIVYVFSVHPRLIPEGGFPPQKKNGLMTFLQFSYVQ